MATVIETIINEAQNEGLQGMIAVANVIRNRAETRGLTPEQVVNEPGQFDPIRKEVSRATASQTSAAMNAWQGVSSGAYGDNTGGATFFTATSIPKSKLGVSGLQTTKTIGGHVFYSHPSEQVAARVSTPPLPQLRSDSNAALAYAPADATPAQDAAKAQASGRTMPAITTGGGTFDQFDPMVANRFQQTVQAFNEQYGPQGYRIEIAPGTGGRRTDAQQMALRQRVAGPAALPANTWHTVGGAADFVIYKDGVRDKGTRSGNAYQALLAPIAARYGLSNPIRNDVGHFQPVEAPAARRGAELANYIPPVPRLDPRGALSLPAAPSSATDSGSNYSPFASIPRLLFSQEAERLMGSGIDLPSGYAETGYRKTNYSDEYLREAANSKGVGRYWISPEAAQAELARQSARQMRQSAENSRRYPQGGFTPVPAIPQALPLSSPYASGMGAGLSAPQASDFASRVRPEYRDQAAALDRTFNDYVSGQRTVPGQFSTPQPGGAYDTYRRTQAAKETVAANTAKMPQPSAYSTLNDILKSQGVNYGGGPVTAAPPVSSPPVIPATKTATAPVAVPLPKFNPRRTTTTTAKPVPVTPTPRSGGLVGSLWGTLGKAIAGGQGGLFGLLNHPAVNMVNQLPVSQQTLGQNYGGYTPTALTPANFNPTQGGSQYDYTTGYYADGTPTTSYTTESGRTYTFSTNPDGTTRYY